MKKNLVDGSNILYHYLQKELYENDIWMFQMLTAKLVASLGIWFKPDFYQKFPLFVPYAVRDPTCRRSRGGIEEWGMPDKNGFFRDDNSLIKGIPKSLKIISPLEIYNGRSLGNGFVASHIWRVNNEKYEGSTYSTRNPLTYSFVPNLVWLPNQVSKLSDREGSFTQLYLQALSIKIYKKFKTTDNMKDLVNRIWSLLPEPISIPESGLPDINEISFFENTPKFFETRKKKIKSVIDALEIRDIDSSLEKKVISTRYSEGIKKMETKIAKELSLFLRNYYDPI